MADRELRHMRRTELVEILFALKQSEDQLKTENAALTAQLAQRQIHLDKAGSIAQAALELNHVFEAAQAAADDYLASVQAANQDVQAAADAIRDQARADAAQILAEAQAQADRLLAQTQRECQEMTQEAQRRCAQIEVDCAALRARTQRELQQRRAAFEQETAQLLSQHCSTDILPKEGEAHETH